jgi:hypothetical protein
MEHLNQILIACGTIFMATAFMLLAKRSIDKDKAEHNAKHPIHHDHRNGSFYQISQQVRRDQKKERGY